MNMIEERRYTYQKRFARVLVISDTHKDISNAISMIQIGGFDQVIHLGDLKEDANDLMSIFPGMIIHVVRGNCDFYDRSTPERLIIEINGVRIFACHGHQYGVKNGVESIKNVAQKRDADLAVFGHSHSQFLRYDEDITLLNPGSISEPRDGKHPSCGILEIEENGRLHCNLHEIKKK